MDHKWMTAVYIPCEVVECDCGNCDPEVQILPMIDLTTLIAVDVSGTDAYCMLCKKPFKEVYGTNCDIANTIIQN